MDPIHLLIIASSSEIALLQRAAEARGMRVTAMDPDKVSEEMDAHGFDGAVVSAALVSPDGIPLRVLARMRQIRGRPKIVLLSGEGNLQSASRIAGFEADATFGYPLDPDAVISSIRELVSASIEDVQRDTLHDVVWRTLELAFDRALEDVLGGMRSESQERSASQDVGDVLSEAEEEELRAYLRRLGDLVAEGDYFAVLGLPFDASEEAIRCAWQKAHHMCELAKRRDFGPGWARTLSEIERVLDEAYRVLGHRELREAYKVSLQENRARSGMCDD